MIEYLFIIAQAYIFIFGIWKSKILTDLPDKSINTVVLTVLCMGIVTLIGEGIMAKLKQKSNEDAKSK